MAPQLSSPLVRLSNEDLMAEVERLAGCERDATAQLIAHLAELDAVKNIALRCRPHNGHEAELFFGPRGPNGGEGRVRESTATYGRFVGTGNSFRNEFRPPPTAVSLLGGRG